MNSGWKHLARAGLGLFLLGLAARPAGAQWTTQTFELKEGWSAIYVHVDATHTTVGSLVGSYPIEEIWMWVPPVPGTQTFDDPQQPTATATTNWRRWDRFRGDGSSDYNRLLANTAYLVRASEPIGAWPVVGRPLAPRLDWSSTDLNFLGFATPAAAAPSWSSFLGPARQFHEHAEIYHYTGGPFSETNPARLLALRTIPVRRGEAFWVRAEEHNRYFGPFDLRLQSSGGIDFGEASGQYRFRLRNATAAALTVTAAVLASEAAPAGQIPVVGTPPLLLRGELDLTDLTYSFTSLNESGASWTLAPQGEAGSEVEVVVGLNRSAMAGDGGDRFAAILRLTDSLGHMQLDLPVAATVASTAGLWVGNALVTEVRHYLAEYERDGEGELTQDEDGRYIITEIDQSFGAVARPFPLRLIIHNGEAGAILLQRVYVGLQSEDHVVVSKNQSALHPAFLPDARRISVAHLPWSRNNVSWPFNGGLHGAAEIEATVVLDYNDRATNPFVHSYHPDHDNLDARFENVLPQGVESYGATRLITLRVLPPGGDFAAVTGGGGILSGVYEETVTLRGRGSATREYQVRGGFALHRVSKAATLTD